MRSPLTRALVLPALLSAALWAGPAPVTASSGPWGYASANRVEVYAAGGPEDAGRALTMALRLRALFEQLLRLPAAAGPPTRVLVFDGRKAFAPYVANPSVTSFFQSGLDHDVITLPQLGDGAFTAMAHELIHVANRRAGRRYPLWLDDGLAELFSTVTLHGGQVRIGAPPAGRTQSLGFGVRLMPLEQLFAVTRRSTDYTDPARARLFYAQSWALTHMLFVDERYRDKRADLLAALGDNGPSALALTRLYGRNVDAISDDLTKYALRGAWRTFQADAPAPDAAAGGGPREAALFEAGVVLADLLGANPDHAARAAEAFQSLASANPNDLFLLETRGLFGARRGDPGAEFDLDDAIARGSMNGRVYAHRAVRLDGPDQDRDEALPLFDKALALAPDDIEVRMLVASAWLARHRGAEADQLLTGIERPPVEYADALGELQRRTRARQRERLADGRITVVECQGASRVVVMATPAGERRFSAAANGPAWPAPVACGARDLVARVAYVDAPAGSGVDGLVVAITVR